MKKIIILLIPLIICGCTNNYAELNNLAVVTGIALDKNKNEYEVSVLIANSPKTDTSNKEGQSQTTVYSGKGKTISKAITEIEQKSPTKLYYSHINVAVISKQIGKEGYLKTSDWLLRNPQTRKRFYLMQANNSKAKDILKIVSPLESFPSQNIATLINTNKNTKGIASAVTYSNFIGRALEKGIDPVLSSIDVIGDTKKGANQDNVKSTQPKAYLKLGPLSLYKDGKLIGFTTDAESKILNMLKNETTEINYDIKYKNDEIEIYSNDIKSKITLKNDKEVNITVTGTSNIYNISSNINLKNINEIKKIEKKLNKDLKQNINKTIKNMQTKYKTDVLGYGNLIYKKYPKKWKTLEKNWNDENFKNIKTNIKVDIKIKSTGSINTALRRVNK